MGGGPAVLQFLVWGHTNVWTFFYAVPCAGVGHARALIHHADSCGIFDEADGLPSRTPYRRKLLYARDDG